MARTIPQVFSSNDPSLYNRLDSLVGSADRLMRDLQENPKRYVHLSIF